ncbi:hypothetical protein GJ496_011618 [Pomphorhynchus laevis]|nr:hypothetical protein GJ496_011618 [Pomphorhynchus laevis]
MTHKCPYNPRSNGQCKRMNGTSKINLSLWLSSPGPVLIKNFAHRDKFEPKVFEVDLIEANRNSALIRFPNVDDIVGIDTSRSERQHSSKCMKDPIDETSRQHKRDIIDNQVIFSRSAIPKSNIRVSKRWEDYIQ